MPCAQVEINGACSDAERGTVNGLAMTVKSVCMGALPFVGCSLVSVATENAHTWPLGKHLAFVPKASATHRKRARLPAGE